MLKYIILGIVQGLTEFLPVSSSGHLVIMQRILGIAEQQIAITVILHLGTALALVIFFFKDILRLLRDIKALFLVFIITLITGAIAIAGRDFFESLFSAPRFVAVAWLGTGIILLLTKRFTDSKRSDINIKDAIILGFTQGVAIIPGISRSGITVSTLLFRRIDRKTAFRFSFLASIPAVFGAVILEAKDIGCVLNIGSANLILGFAFSFFSGLMALWLLKLVIDKARLYYFGYYCILAGIITLLFLK